MDLDRTGVIVRLSLAQVNEIQKRIDDDASPEMLALDDLLFDALDRAREGRPGYHVDIGQNPTAYPTTMFEMFAQIDWETFPTYMQWLRRINGPPGLTELCEYIWNVAHNGYVPLAKES